MEFFIEILGVIVGVFLACAILLLLIALPITYLEGEAKAEWIRQNKGIELPWHKAAFLDVEINDVNVTSSNL